MDKVEVTAYFDTQGNITPLNFIWNRSTFRIEDTGRRWDSKSGKHMLVMISGDRVFHLMFEVNTCTWNLVHGNIHPPKNQF